MQAVFRSFAAIFCGFVVCMMLSPLAAFAADYKVDGKYLRAKNGNRIAEFDGRYFRDARGNRTGELDGKHIRDARGNRVAEIDGDNIRVNGSKVGTIADVRKVIDGPGGASLAGFWILFIR